MQQGLTNSAVLGEKCSQRKSPHSTNLSAIESWDGWAHLAGRVLVQVAFSIGILLPLWRNRPCLTGSEAIQTTCSIILIMGKAGAARWMCHPLLPGEHRTQTCATVEHTVHGI